MRIKFMQNYANFPGVLECNALKVFEFFIATRFFRMKFYLFYMNIVSVGLLDPVVTFCSAL